MKVISKKVIEQRKTYNLHIKNNHNYIANDCIISNCHTTGGSKQIRDILSKSINAEYKIGVTGTIPTAALDIFNIKAFLGPIIRRYSAKELGDAGYVSQCRIMVYKLSHTKEFAGEYFDIRRAVVCNPARMEFIRKTIEGLGGDNILILVNNIENEGKVLEAYLRRHLPDHEVIFLWGDTKVKEREFHRKDMDTRKNKIIIATYPIFKMGVNIPSLKYIMFASPLKSKISVLQSVGRVLRKHLDKVDGARVIDLIDIVPYLETHGEVRMKYYKKENFEIDEQEICLQGSLL